MKIVVTGGCGFIGSCLIRKLMTETHVQVINIDKMTYASTEQSLWSVDRNERYTFYKDDICNQSALASIFEKQRPDAVYHLAAESHVDRSISGPADFLETNIMGTYSLAQTTKDYLEKYKPKNFKFIHVSTDEVYGSLPLDGEGKFHEAYPYQPNSPYSASKAASDFIIRSWFHTYHLPGIITHCSNNYGPYQLPEKLIPKAIINFAQLKDVPVYGNGKNIRDWIHVEDHCDGLIAAMRLGKPGETYDFGGNCERQNIDIVQAIGLLVEGSMPEGYDSSLHIKYVTDRQGHDLRYAVDSRKALNELNWSPRIPFELGLEKTVSWYLRNTKWWSKDVKEAAYAV